MSNGDFDGKQKLIRIFKACSHWIGVPSYQLSSLLHFVKKL